MIKPGTLTTAEAPDSDEEEVAGAAGTTGAGAIDFEGDGEE